MPLSSASSSPLLWPDSSEDGDPATRPPLLVTATVEAIEVRASHLELASDMTMSGAVVWTGTSSMDICMELEQVWGVPQARTAAPAGGGQRPVWDLEERKEAGHLQGGE